MTFNPDIHHRCTTRFAGYDYSQNGAYFVTVCASRRGEIFGEVADGGVILNQYGRIILECWSAIPLHFSQVRLDEFIAMPDHIHGILFISQKADEPGTGAQHVAPLRVVPGSLGAILRLFKGAVTRQVREHRIKRSLSPVQVWQRNYHDRIIRNEKELNEIRRYIIENPTR